MQVQSLMVDVEDVKGNLEETRQQAALTLAGEIERVQDNTELLFSTWSETVKQEVEQRQDKLIQHAEGRSLAAEIKMRELNDMSAKMSSHIQQTEDLQKEVTFLKVQEPFFWSSDVEIMS